MRATDFSAGVDVLETALAYCRTAGLPAVSALVSAALIICCANTPELVARARLGLGELYAGRGRIEDARTELTAANILGATLGMPMILARSSEALERLGC